MFLPHASIQNLSTNKFLYGAEKTELMDWIQNHPGRDSTLLHFALCTGARRSEILQLQQKDFAHGRVHIHATKLGMDRELTLPPNLYAQIIQSFKTKFPAERAFPFSKSTVYAIWDKHRPVKKKFHSLRHTFAIDIYLQTKNIYIVQRMLGHRNINNTLVYQNFEYTMEYTDEVMREFFGKMGWK